MLLYIHVLFGALWFGTAATLPFWGNRMNRADHLDTVLGIIDTVFVLKCVFIMSGLIVTLGTGLMMANHLGFSLDFTQNPQWLGMSELLAAVIFINSWIIFFFIYLGRKGKRTLMRIVPPIGYTNIALIGFVMMLMVKKPVNDVGFTALIFLAAVLLANAVNIVVKVSKRYRIRKMSPQEFANLYFGLLNDEKMTDLFKLFDDKTEFNDPFATGPIKGILMLEKFFQALGDQFDNIKMYPRCVSGTPDKLLIEWEAVGVTKNGIKMDSLNGTNNMTRKNGKIVKVDIEFDTAKLPPVQLVSV